jgi:hypothetical protein
LFAKHAPAAQSAGAMHDLPSAHFGHAGPPQSTSVSAPSFALFEQLGDASGAPLSIMPESGPASPASASGAVDASVCSVCDASVWSVVPAAQATVPAASTTHEVQERIQVSYGPHELIVHPASEFPQGAAPTWRSECPSRE